MGTRSADAPIEQIHRRAADKARHKAAGGFFIHLNWGADLLGNTFVHYHYPLGEGHRFNLIVRHVQRGGFQSAMQML